MPARFDKNPDMAMMAGMNRFFASTRHFESRLRKAG